MGLFGSFFSKSPSDMLSKGDKYMASDSFFDARTCYEDGLHLCGNDSSYGDLSKVFKGRIETANLKLAERNIIEAESAYSRGDISKAKEHLELVKTLTYDVLLREKAEKLLLKFSHPDLDDAERSGVQSCGSCTGFSGNDSVEIVPTDDSLPLMEYFELLIQQLPRSEYLRYAELGENFACAYVAASRDQHNEALSGFEECSDSLPRDIYCYEKGKLFHRLGNDCDAEGLFRSAIQLNASNSLAWLSLVLILTENNRFVDALNVIESMVSENIMPEQALLLRGDIFEATGDYEAAMNQYVELLQTSYARVAGEKLYGVLLERGRESDAAVIFKKYLKKSCH